ncbi:hypothetical protein E2P81_ATG03941 [Venturia nashicola]|nr:hypothetical protein E2P81_ATG03941 [Venturia nashicola]
MDVLNRVRRRQSDTVGHAGQTLEGVHDRVWGNVLEGFKPLSAATPASGLGAPGCHRLYHLAPKQSSSSFDPTIKDRFHRKGLLIPPLVFLSHSHTSSLLNARPEIQ